MIEVEHLTKDYGTVVAVRDISFSVGRGEVVGFLGPNGAGKSTTLRILAGFIGPTSGRVSIAGHDVTLESLKARRCLGYMPEAQPLYPELTVGEYLQFRAAVKGVARKQRKSAIERAMQRASITDMRETLILHLSKGYRQRVALADALVADPPLLILDEPTAGLDPNQIREVRALIQELGKDHTILLSTHILSEVEASCNRAIVIHRGRLVAEGKLDVLQGRRGSSSMRLELRDPSGRALKVVSNVSGIQEVRSLATESGDDKLSRLEVTLGADASEYGAVTENIVRALVKADVFVRAVVPLQASLEEVFAELTRTEQESPEKQPEERNDAQAKKPS